MQSCCVGLPNHNMRKLTSLATLMAFVLGAVALHAQRTYDGYKWDENPQLSVIADSLKEENTILVFERVAREIDLTDSGELVEYLTMHTIRKVNNDRGVEASNRIYLTVSNNDRVIQQEARVITPDGRVIRMTPDKIKVAVDEETEQKRKYFALEGLEVGSDVEYVLQLQRPANYRGTRVIFQDTKPQLSTTYELRYPASLHFVWKQENFDVVPALDTLSEHQAGVSWNFDFVPGLRSEPMANMRKHLMAFHYKLEASRLTGKSRLVNFADATSSIYSVYMEEGDKNEQKAVKSFIKKMNIPKSATNDEKALLLNSWIKQNIAHVEHNAQELADLSQILSLGAANDVGYYRLYAKILRALGVPYEMVVTVSRDKMPFDSEFESYAYLDEILFYFPETKKYVDPTDLTSCPGIVINNYLDNYGLFIKEVEVAGITAGVGKVKPMRGALMEDNKDVMHIKATLDMDEQTVLLDYSKINYGQYAKNFQPYFSFIDESTSEELKEQMVKWIGEGLEITSNEVRNTGLKHFGKDPLEQDFTARADDFINIAGNKVLFEIGKLIGPQSEMYMDHPRTLPVDAGFRHMYERSIEFEVPEGFAVRNLESLDLDVRPEADGRDAIGFRSTYTVDGTTVRVEIEEYYNEVFFSAEEFEKYRAVINAAADFNKIVLVLEKV